MNFNDITLKNSIAIRITRQMALDLGVAVPTLGEAAAQQLRYEKYRVWKKRHDEQQAAMLEALEWHEDAPTRAILDLHRATTPNWCDGCDYSGYESEPGEWPCRTIYALAKAHGIDTPEEYRA